MGITRKPSGRFIVGLGVTDGNDYKEVGALKDLFIQLTADGCTDESQNYLNYLADYAEYHSGIGEPIMPPGVNVWLSNNGTTTAVEADDLSLEDGTYTICGITCTDGEWDFSNAGQQGGGGGLPEVDDSDNGKVLTVVEGEWAAASGGGGGGGALIVKCTGTAVYEAGDDGGYWNIPVDTSFADIFAAMESGPVYISIPLLSTTEPYYKYRNDGKVLLPVYIMISNGVEYSGEVLCPSDMSLGGTDAKSISLTEFNDVGETLEIIGDISP